MAAWKAAPAGASGTPDRVELEFTSASSYELALDSLEDARNGIRLLAVRRDADTDTVHATVCVPPEAQGHFLKRLDEYLAKETAKGAPRHQKLVAPIEHIALASLPSLWTDTASLPAELDVPIRWEVWLRIEGELPSVLIEQFRRVATDAGLLVSSRHLKFVDRAVLLVQGTSRQLTSSRAVMALVAEVRLAKESAGFFVTMPRADQAAWVQDLTVRTTSPGPNAPRVCLLDTGVNRGHVLLDSALAPDDMHTYNSAWGVHDEGPQGPHGTGMAGLVLYGDLIDALASRGPVVLTHRLESSKILSGKERNPPEL